MDQIESLIFLLGAAALLAQLARVVRIPYPIFLVLGGLALGFAPGLPTVEIPPEVIFVVFLPPLLNSAGFFSSPLDLRAHLRAISLLAVGLVLATIFAVAAAAHFVVGLSWPLAFVLGAILSPTDPVAAEAIFRRLGVPERVGTVVGGESLINDGTALVASWGSRRGPRPSPSPTPASIFSSSRGAASSSASSWSSPSCRSGAA
jgi:CPA1 family monovalent cation:H+ antiporter